MDYVLSEPARCPKCFRGGYGKDAGGAVEGGIIPHATASPVHSSAAGALISNSSAGQDAAHRPKTPLTTFTTDLCA